MPLHTQEGAMSRLKRLHENHFMGCDFSSVFDALNQLTPTKKRWTPDDGAGLSFGRIRRMTRDRLKPVSSLRASRHRRSVPNVPRVVFDRTADLCHVKADWPHQDRRGRLYTKALKTECASYHVLPSGIPGHSRCVGLTASSRRSNGVRQSPYFFHCL